jgi:cobalamin biosynthesis protein CobD/CbiB
MDSRVLRKFLGHILWGMTWLLVLVSVWAIMVYVSLALSGNILLLGPLTGLVFVILLGGVILWQYCHQQVVREDRHNAERDKRNARH